MTKGELLKMLEKVPDDAIVRIKKTEYVSKDILGCAIYYFKDSDPYVTLKSF